MMENVRVSRRSNLEMSRASDLVAALKLEAAGDANARLGIVVEYCRCDEVGVALVKQSACLFEAVAGRSGSVGLNRACFEASLLVEATGTRDGHALAL